MGRLHGGFDRAVRKVVAKCHVPSIPVSACGSVVGVLATTVSLGLEGNDKDGYFVLVNVLNLLIRRIQWCNVLWLLKVRSCVPNLLNLNI